MFALFGALCLFCVRFGALCGAGADDVGELLKVNMFLMVLVGGVGLVLVLGHFVVEKMMMLLVVKILTIVMLMLVLTLVMVTTMVNVMVMKQKKMVMMTKMKMEVVVVMMLMSLMIGEPLCCLSE